MNYRRVTHESIPPFINEDSKVLILGSLPSVKSIQDGFFYAHPQNRFFKTLSALFDEEEPKRIDERKAFLKKHYIGLYDVIYECDIIGSSDSSIKNVVPIKLKEILAKYPSIKAIFCTGNKSKQLFDKYLLNDCDIPVYGLSSTSPANARISQQQLIEEYKQITCFL